MRSPLLQWAKGGWVDEAPHTRRCLTIATGSGPGRVRGATPMPASPEHRPERAAVRAGRIGLLGVAFPRVRPLQGADTSGSRSALRAPH